MDQKDLISDINNFVENSINYNLEKEINNNSIEIDPIIINKNRTNSTAFCIGVLVMLKYRDIKKVVIEKDTLDNHIQYYRKHYQWICHLLDSYGKLTLNEKEQLNGWYLKLYDQDFSNVDISKIYETLISFGWFVENGTIQFKLDKSNRNRSGSYYTPANLAEVSIQKTLDERIEKTLSIASYSLNFIQHEQQVKDVADLLTSIKIIDFSCGTGHFIQAIITYFKMYVSPLLNGKADLDFEQEMLNKLCCNLWGVDIDYIALEIAKTELMYLVKGSDNYKAIVEHFIHGNPLIDTQGILVSNKEKEDITAAGYLYHEKLGVNWQDYEKNITDGFDLVIGNPPWEKIRLEEKAFFSHWAPSIANLNRKNDRAKEIQKLKRTSPLIYEYYESTITQLNISKSLIESNQMFRNSAIGELNTYALFTELATSFLSSGGNVCYVVKSALIVSPVNKKLFNYLVSNNLVISCYDFINKKRIFEIDNRERFCVLILGENSNTHFYFKTHLTDSEDILSGNDLRINKRDLKLLNPLTGMMPSVSNTLELEFLIKVHSNHPVLEEVIPDCHFGRLVHFTSHADDIYSKSTNDNIPIYEGKFIGIYDGRYTTYKDIDPEKKFSNKARARRVSDKEKEDPLCISESRYYIYKQKWYSLTKNYDKPYSLMWRSMTSASNSRTCISTILPHMPASQSVQFLQHSSKKTLVILLAVFNSIVFDYMLRLKLNGIDLTQRILKQIAFPNIDSFEEVIKFNKESATIYEHIAVRISFLLGDDKRMWSFANEIIPKGYSVNAIKNQSRKKNISEIDYLIARTYKIERTELYFIAQNFPNFYSDKEINEFF